MYVVRERGAPRRLVGQISRDCSARWPARRGLGGRFHSGRM